MHALERHLSLTSLLLILFWPALIFAVTPEVEEIIYSIEPANNGAGPLWDFGSTNLQRIGSQVYVSGLETLSGIQPLNNTQCNLWQRASDGWKMILSDSSGRTREPCPLAVFPAQQKLFLSANSTLNPPEKAGPGPSKPILFEFSTQNLSVPPVVLFPLWKKKSGFPAFTEHSYRSFAADGVRGELVLFHNIEYSHAEWSFRDSSGKWAVQGQLKWPWGAEYEKPKPIRICFPNVAIHNRAVHLVGVSDVVEANETWRRFKRELSGKDWDYDMRRLFYTKSSDITRQGFSDWLEIASREKTAGHITPGDLWLAPDDSAHIVWDEAALDMRLRDKFFPNEKQRWELNYAVVRAGKVESRKALLTTDEGTPGPIPHLPRFQVTPDGRLFIFFYVNGTDDAGKALSENRLLEIFQDGSVGQMISVPLAHPLNNYMTATVRAGSAPSFILDLLGTEPGQPNTIRYARVLLD